MRDGRDVSSSDLSEFLVNNLIIVTNVLYTSVDLPSLMSRGLHVTMNKRLKKIDNAHAEKLHDNTSAVLKPLYFLFLNYF